MKTSKLKSAILLYLAGMVVIHGMVFWNVRELVRKGYSDFTIYYCAGTMVREGLGHQLYDDRAQFRVQREFSPEVAVRLDALPYNHPPFEAVLFAPFTYLFYDSAFVLWSLANLAMVAALPFLLRPHLPRLKNYPWWMWVLASLGFFPIFFALLQGQDAILLLFLYTLAFVCLKKDRDVSAGGWLACGLFKPHLVLPFVFLLLVQGRRKLLYGFLPVVALLALISFVIVGREGILTYPLYVLHMEQTTARGAILLSDMPNLRGFWYLLLDSNSYRTAVTLASSVGMILFAAWQLGGVGDEKYFELKVSLASVVTVLVSYHALGYDLSVLMLPIFLLASEFSGNSNSRTWPAVLIITGVAGLFCSPLQLVLLMRGNHLAVVVWAVVSMMCGIAGRISWCNRQSGTAA